ncbi:MAG: RNA polymerase sigma factor [Thermoflexibacter sp.]|jgi:RNA polymerase sigma-70 factor (ECF subfamily)|nr:RNA polymerase sigma factor [Thermoflexibacter sp.]
MTEEEIIKRLVHSNDTSAFSLLYDKYADKIYYKCISFVKDKQLAQDLTHDIFVKIFISIKKFNFQSSFSTWVYRITYNFCIDFLRKQQKQQLSRLEEDEDFGEDEYSDEELFAISVDRLELILDQIPAEDRAILLMKYQDDLSIKDIMTTLDISESATKMRLKRAKEKVVMISKQL